MPCHARQVRSEPVVATGHRTCVHLATGTCYRTARSLYATNHGAAPETASLYHHHQNHQIMSHKAHEPFHQGPSVSPSLPRAMSIPPLFLLCILLRTLLCRALQTTLRWAWDQVSEARAGHGHLLHPRSGNIPRSKARREKDHLGRRHLCTALPGMLGSTLRLCHATGFNRCWGGFRGI